MLSWKPFAAALVVAGLAVLSSGDSPLSASAAVATVAAGGWSTLSAGGSSSSSQSSGGRDFDQPGRSGSSDTSSTPAAAAAIAAIASVSDSPPADCADAPDVMASCGAWAAAGECDTNPAYMLQACALSCGCRSPPPPPPPECADRDTSGACAHWAASGECEANPAYMKLRCAASCGSCDMLDYKKRCPMPENRTVAVPPGAMAETFERALSAEFASLEPKVLSRDPWVLSFDRFLTPDEIEALLEHGEGRYVRSTASGGRKNDEFVPLTSEIRTSWTTWCAMRSLAHPNMSIPHAAHSEPQPPLLRCDNATCYDDPRVQRITERVSDVTRVPAANFEYMQLLPSLPCQHPTHPDCQFYRRHHDTIPELATMQPGPRVYTFFLYLSDVEEGGGTRFDGGFTVQPKAGRALFWPATLNHDPFTSDDRTHHEALPVTRGIKYAANFWLHQYDYVSAHKAGCTS